MEENEGNNIDFAYEVNCLEENRRLFLHNNSFMKDFNIILERVDSESLNNAKMTNKKQKHFNQHSTVSVNSTAKQNREAKRKSSQRNQNRIIAKLKKKRNTVNQQNNKEISSRSRKSESTFLKTNKSLEKLEKRVSFKTPLTKYRFIKPVKHNKTKKLVIMLTRCDEIEKNK